MADISLRDYLAKLDGLLNDGASDEVIHHCRHILQYFPKNAATYRYLGRALVYGGNWDKAAEVFRRVLSVYPDDYIAHAGLSEAYLNLKRPEEAMWHLERAYEQDPNNQEVIEALREMYRKFRRVDQSRLQLTAGAVAQQYIRNGLYEQAIDSLRQVLVRSPERVDLRLLLARTYNDAGRQVEAGETALEILSTLPDCLEANQILTEIWLAVQRPSDAQRYLNRIQSVDPYLALQLAQGQPVPDDQFRLEELDYRRSAQEEIISRTPDWLQAIEPAAPADTAPDADYGDWMQPLAASSQEDDEEPLPDFSDDLFSTDLPADWLTGQPENESVPSEAAQHPRTGLTGLLSVLNEPEAAEAEPAPEPDTAFDDLFAAAEPETAQETELEPDAVDMLPEVLAGVPSPEPGSRSDDDPLAWLQGSGIELVDEPAPVTFEEDDDIIAVQAADEVNPLAWLEGYGDDLIADEVKTPSSADQSEDAISSASDALDWLQTDSTPTTEGTPAQASVDPLDWLADENLLDEALSLEALTGTEAAEAISDDIVWAQTDTTLESDRQDAMAEDNPFAWLDSQDDDQQAQDDQQPELGGDDWFADLGAPEAGSSAPEAQPEFGEPGDEFEWIASEAEVPEPAGMLDWLTPSSEQQPESEPSSDLDWLQGGESQAEEPAVTAGEMPEWMAQLQPSEMADEEPEAEPATEMPEWLTQTQPEDAEPAAEPMGDEFGWMAEAETGEEAEAEAAPEMPEWLTQAQPEDAEPAAEPMGDEFGWMAEAETGEEAEVEPAAEMPEWMAELQPSEMADDEEPAVEAESEVVPDWMNELQSQQPEVADEEWSEAAASEAETSAEAVPDWLAEMQSRPPRAAEPEAVEVTAEAEPVELEAADEFEWPSDEQLTTGVVPEWLTQLEAQEPEAEAQEPEAAGELAWMENAESDEEETVPGTESAVPDWLSQIQPPAGAAAAEEAFSWMAEVEDSDEEPAADNMAETPAYAGETPEWLSAVEEPAEPESAEFSWIDDINAPADEADAAPSAEVAGMDGEFEYPQAESGEEELAPAPANNAPDWLNAMVPGLDVDYAAPEDEPIEQAFADEVVAHRTTRSTTEVPAALPPRKDFDWLVDIVDEESRQMPAVEAGGERKRFVFSRQPAWLRQPVEQRDDAPSGGAGPAAANDDDSDLPPWLR